MLAGHPVVRSSWEGFVIENLATACPAGTVTVFYSTLAGAEADLFLDSPGAGERWAIDIKRGLAPQLSKGFHNVRKDLSPTRSFLVFSREECFPM